MKKSKGTNPKKLTPEQINVLELLQSPSTFDLGIILYQANKKELRCPEIVEFLELRKNVINTAIEKFWITKENGEYVVNVEGDVIIPFEMTELPFKFGIVTGFFDCSFSGTKTLRGSPVEVGGNFDCQHNRLTSLEGCPKKVGGNFWCGKNPYIFSEEQILKICSVGGQIRNK